MKIVTICIPLYNAETTIARTLDSLLAQDYPINKIKIFDNVSTDKGTLIVLDYQKRYSNIELHINDKNLGGEGNFTKCIQAAEGDFCLLAHSDDLYEPSFISKSVKVFESDPTCMATFCAALEIDSNEHVIGKRFFPSELAINETTYLNKNELLKLFFKYGNFVTCPSVIVRSNIYRDKIQIWNGKKYNTSADLDVWIRISEFGTIAAIKTPLIKYRVAEVSYSYRVAKIRIARHDLFLVLDQYLTLDHVDDYYFLAIKDQSLRCLNIIRNNLRDQCFPSELKLRPFLLIKKMLCSKWHFKFGFAIFTIFLIVNFLVFIGRGKKCPK